MTNPKISILMGIYNCESTLAESIESIIDQTYTNWELIMCDDGSSDGTLTIAKYYEEQNPDKIKVIQNEQNQGLNYTLNHCATYVTGEFIARQDGDDISLPARFEKEISLLLANPELAIVSTGMIYFDESGEWGQSKPTAKPTKTTFIKGTPFAHAPSMMRTAAFQAVNGYSDERRLLRVEDYHLWIKLYAAGYSGQNILEPLYKMRDDRNATNRRKYKYRMNEAYVRYVAFKKLDLPLIGLAYVFRPLIVGLLPTFVYEILHKKRLAK
ncbi:MAG: glycosyltransferase [Culicoidibacterales bacterium]